MCQCIDVLKRKCLLKCPCYVTYDVCFTKLVYVHCTVKLQTFSENIIIDSCILKDRSNELFKRLSHCYSLYYTLKSFRFITSQDGLISAIGKAGNPDSMAGVTPVRKYFIVVLLQLKQSCPTLKYKILKVLLSFVLV